MCPQLWLVVCLHLFDLVCLFEFCLFCFDLFCSGDRRCNCAPSASLRVWRFLCVLFHRLQRAFSGEDDRDNAQVVAQAMRPLPDVGGGVEGNVRGVDHGVATGDVIEQALIRQAGP